MSRDRAARVLSEHRPRHVVAGVLYDALTEPAHARTPDELAAIADALLDAVGALIAGHALRAAVVALPRGEGGDACSTTL